MSDFDINSVEHLADLEMKAKYCLSILDNIENGVISTLKDIIEIDNNKPDLPDFEARKKYDDSLNNIVLGVIGFHAVELASLKKIVGNLKTDNVFSVQYKHDIGNFLVPVVAGFDLLLGEIDEDTNHNDSKNNIYERLRTPIKNIVSHWYRCRVGLEDMALRTISENEIPEKFIKGLDIKIIKSVLDFFSMKELQSLRKKSLLAGSDYKNIDNKELDISEIDWRALENKLDNKKIIGNEGLVGNFLINALRNSLKDRVGSIKTKVKIDVVDNELIIRVEDDGKGMEQKHLNPDFKEIDTDTGQQRSYFIFDKGVSDTSSSGLGLANFNTRLASTGGALYVVSKRRSVESTNEPIRYQCGGSDEKKKSVMFDYVDSGTVFEIHLKLEDKNKI